MNIIRTALAVALVGFSSLAQAQVAGTVGWLETHVSTQELRFYLGTSPWTTLCSTSNKEAYFSLTPTGNYTQGVIDNLRDQVRLSILLGTSITVYTSTSGSRCLVTDIVLTQ